LLILIVKYYSSMQLAISNILQVVNVTGLGGQNIMECLTSKQTINDTVEVVNNISFSEKKDSHLSDDEINKFLDDISVLRTLLEQKISAIDNINQLLQKISWLRDLNDECLKLLNILILVGKDFHSTLTKGFTPLDKLSESGIAVSEICNFKESVDDLLDVLDDLEMSFFVFPKNEDFIEINNKLSAL